MTTSNSNKRERSMESAQPASKKAKVTNRGTWSRYFAEVEKDRKIIGVIDQSDEGGRIPRNQWGLVRRALASVALKVLDENPGPPPKCTDAGWYQGHVKFTRLQLTRSARSTPEPSWQLARLQTSRLDRERGCGFRRNHRNQWLYSACWPGSTRNFQQTVGRWSRWRKPSASPWTWLSSWTRPAWNPSQPR